MSSQRKKKKSLDLQKKIVAEKIDTLKSNPSQNGPEIRKLKKIEKELNDACNKIRPKKSNIVWPQSSMNAEPRTREAIKDIIEKIENGQELSIDEAKGITGRSLLFDLPSFDFIDDNPVDYLHGVCLGVVKRCVELTFKVGDARTRETKRKLSLPSQFNSQIHVIKVFHEFNRRIRNLDFSVYKGQEFRNLLLFFFPLILNCIEPNERERNMWLYLTYMIKACVVPKEEFRPIPLQKIEHCMKSFYSLYETLFGVRNCSYNTHVTSGHLLEMRYSDPLTCTSAFPFESFYGELRNLFCPRYYVNPKTDPD